MVSSNVLELYTSILVTHYDSKGGNSMKKKLLAAIFGAVLVLGACGGGTDTNKCR